VNKIGILGAGAWPLAVASFFKKRNQDCIIWFHESDASVATTRKTCYLQGYSVPQELEFTSSYKDVFDQCDLIIQFIPIQFLRKTIEEFKPFFDPARHKLVSTTKGVEVDSELFPSEIMKEVLGVSEFSCLFFDSKAIDLIEEKVGQSLLIAGHSHEVLQVLHKLFYSPALNIELSLDVAGVQVLMSFKYYFVILKKYLKNPSLSDLAKKSILNKSSRDMFTLVTRFGGQSATMFNLLSGLSDFYIDMHADSPINITGKALPDGSSAKNLDFVMFEQAHSLLGLVSKARHSGVVLESEPLIRDYYKSLSIL